MGPPKLLVCQGCCKGFISKDQFKKKGPVLLDCGHSVCEECALVAASQGPLLSCPHCQQVTLVENKKLPPDAYINGCLVLNVKPPLNEDSLTFVKQKKTRRMSTEKAPGPTLPERRKCEECGVNYGTLRCQKCEDCLFCEACFAKVHRGSKLLSRHVARPVPADPEVDRPDGGAPAPARCCHLHDGRPLEYYCTDDSVAVCSHCSISGEHKGHTVEPLSSRVERWRPQLEEAAARARTTYLRLRLAGKNLREAPAAERPETAAVLDAIQEHFSQLHGRLQLRQRALSAQLMAAAESQRDRLRQLETALEQSCDAARRVLSEAEAALSGGAAAVEPEPLLERLTAAANQPCHLVWTEPERRVCRVQFVAEPQLLTSIGQHGSLEVDVQSPVRLVAEADLPPDHVVQDVTPDVLIEGDSVTDTASVSSECSARSAAASGPAAAPARAPARRPSTSPRPTDNRMAAVFPSPPPPAPAGAGQRGRATTPAPGADTRQTTGPFGQERVLVTHVRSPAQFYVQRCGEERRLQALMRRVGQWCRSADSETNMHRLNLSKNELCLAQYMADKHWYRARIIDVYPPSEERGPCEFEVFYIDYGNRERVLASCLRPITAALAREPDMAVGCRLWDLVPAGGAAAWSRDATHAFASFVRGESMVMTTIRQGNGLCEVELLKQPNKNIKTDPPQSVRDHLVFIGVANYVGNPKRTAGPDRRLSELERAPVATPGGVRPRSAAVSAVTVTRVESVSADLRQFYAADLLARGSQTDVLVSHVQSPDELYVQQLGVHAEYLTNMMDEMQRVYSSQKSSSHALLSPRKGQVCVSQFTVDSRYYRAVIESLVPPALVDVFYVDYGNRERVTLQAVRKIEDKFMMIPMQALRCQMADIQPVDPKAGWQEAVTRRLIEVTDSKLIKMYVDSVDAAGHTVTLYECRQNADLCINALLAQLDCVRGVAPSTRVVEYTKVGWEPPSREVRSAAASSVGSAPCSGHGRPAAAAGVGAGGPGGASSPASPQHPEADGSSVRVFVSHCESPGRFWVQISDEIPKLNQMMKEMQAVYGAGGVSSHGYTWKPDDVAVARCTADRLFYRVRVRSASAADPDRVQVYLIDYGKTETVQQRDIVVLMQQFEQHREFAVSCHLHGIRPAGDRGAWTGTASDFLRSMLARAKKLFLVTKCISGEESGPIVSLPCDLEAEEHKNVGALEPTRRIRTSLSGKLLEQGLAFSTRRSAEPADLACSPAAAEGPAPLRERFAVQGTRPSGAAAGDAVAAWPTPPPPPPGPDQQRPPTATGSDSEPDDTDMPLGADWATLSAGRPDPVSPGPAGESDRSMLEAELAATAVQEQPAPAGDWLPARLPAEPRFTAVPTHVTMAGTIYLHPYPRGKETLDIINRALSSKFAGSLPRPCDAYWFDGQPCIAKYFLDESWYRAKVLQVHREKVSVQFVDYGNTDRVDPSDLRKNIFMEHVPIQALHCELYNTVPLAEDGHFPVKTLDFIHSQIVDRECHVEVHYFNATKRRLLVSLKLVQSGIDVNELLVRMGDARYMTDDELAAAAGGSEPLLGALLLRSPYRQLRLPAGAPPVPVTCAAALQPGLLLVQPQRVAGEPAPPLARLADHLQAIEAVRDRLDEAARAQPPLQSPAVGVPCLARFSEDGAWYRAVVLSLDGAAARVHYVDWGNVEEVEAASLRELPADMLDVPAWTLLVELHGISPTDTAGWTPQTADALLACLFRPDIQLWATVKQSQREPPLVELVVLDDTESPDTKPRLAYQKLVDDGLLMLSAADRRH